MKTQKKKKGTLICKRRNGNWKCKNVSGENKLQFCERHFKIQKEFLANNPSLLTEETRQLLGIDLTKKNMEEKKEIHKKKRDKEKELPPDEQRCCEKDGRDWRCKNVRMRFDPEADSNAHDSRYCRHHYNYHKDWKKRDKEKKRKRSRGCPTNNCSNKRKKKMKTVVVAEEDDRSLLVEQPATTSSDTSDSDKNVKRAEFFGELDSLTRTRDHVVQLEESLEHYKSKCCELSMELEEKKAECATLQGKLAEVDTIMAAVTDECKRSLADATECWRKMLSEKEKSTMGCLESRLSNLESIVQRMDSENSSAAGCVELRISKLESLNLRIEAENLTRAGCVESRLLNLERLVVRSKKPFASVVSADGGESSGESFKENSDNSIDSRSSLGDLVYKLATNDWNRSIDNEVRWKSEADMLSSFEEDAELCMKAVCALYRQKISEDEISAKGLFHYRDAIRVTTLAEFLMDGDCKGDIKKSVEELEIFDSEAVVDCKMLVRSYSKQLFSIYQNRKDPYFLPTITDSHGDQTGK